MKIRDAFGLGTAEGRTVIPVSIWLPVAVTLLVVAGLVAWGLDAPGGLALVLIGLAAVLVVPVATVITLRRDRRGR